MKKVAVVILNWNGQKLLEQFLPSVVNYTDSALADIIVADNASNDSSIAFVREHYPTLSIVELSDNFGYAEGYNQALKQIDAEYYVLLNSDVEVTENWLQPMINYLDLNQHIAAAQPKILSERRKDYFEYAGACGGFIDQYGYPFCRGRIFDSLEKDHHQYDTPIEIFWASGACLVIRSKDFHACEGFDSSFFAHMEEIDLCWRLNSRNRKVACFPQSIVYHLGGGTLNEESPRKTFLNFRNNLLMLYKNLPEDKLQRVLFVRRYLDKLAALQMRLKGKKKNYKAIIDAYTEFEKIQTKYQEQRKNNIEKTIISAIPTIYPKSILYSFLLKGKKKFDQLNFH